MLNISSKNEIFCQNKNETRKKSGSSNVWLGKGQFPQRREKRPDKSTGRKERAEPCAKATALAMERGKSKQQVSGQSKSLLAGRRGVEGRVVVF